MLLDLRRGLMILLLVLSAWDADAQLGRMATPEDTKPDRFYSVAVGWSPYVSSSISDGKLQAVHGEFMLSDPQNRKQYKVRGQYQWANNLYPIDLNQIPKSLHYLIPNEYYERIMSGDFLFGYNFMKPSRSQLQAFTGVRVSYLQTHYSMRTGVGQTNLSVSTIPRYYWGFHFSIPFSLEYGYHISRLFYLGIEPQYSLSLSSKELYNSTLVYCGKDADFSTKTDIKFGSQVMMFLHLRYYL